MKTSLKYLKYLSKFRFQNNLEALEHFFKIIEWFQYMDYEYFAEELKKDIKIYGKFKNYPVPLKEFQVVHTEYT